MICQFSVKNYKSFQNKMSLDLRATSISEHEEEIFVDLNDGQRFLPLAGIYGPNGGGKTNVIDAILCLVSKVMKPICAVCDQKDCSNVLSKPKKIIPYKFNKKNLDEPTEFEIYFRTKQAQYKYNLSVKNETIISESLFMLKFNGTKPTRLFIRNADSENPNLNPLIFKNINVSGVTDTLPLLSYLGITNKKIEVIKDIFDWFEHGIEIIDYGDSKIENQISIPKSDKIKKLMLTMMNGMDIDIEDYRVDDDDDDHIMVYTKHVVNNDEFELNLNEESRGTLKILGLLPDICRSIQRGTVLIVDELDSKIHPKLLEYIIGLYRNTEVNTKGSQLIFTSHDLMTMTSEFFRRDEIWFVAKNSEQSSKLYSLVEFKKENGKAARKDEKYGKQYLEGRYGADPYLKKMINWSEQLE